MIAKEKLAMKEYEKSIQHRLSSDLFDAVLSLFCASPTVPALLNAGPSERETTPADGC